MKTKLKEEVKHLLLMLRADAEMALDGSWDCSSQEGLGGFTTQIELINKTLEKL